MRGFRDSLESDILLQEKLLRTDKVRLKRLPQGKLKIGKNGVNLYLYKNPDKSKYISRHSQIVKDIRERRFFGETDGGHGSKSEGTKASITDISALYR